METKNTFLFAVAGIGSFDSAFPRCVSKTQWTTSLSVAPDVFYELILVCVSAVDLFIES